MGQNNQVRRRTGRDRRSTRAILPVLGLVVTLLVVGGACGAYAGFFPDSSWRPVAAAASLVQRTESKEKARTPTGYVWTASRSESGLKLRGTIPSEEDRKTMLGMVKAHFPDLKVEERMKIAEGGPPREQWLGAVSFGLQQLSYLKRGTVRLANSSLKVSGVAQSADDYVKIKKALAGPLPAGLVIRGDEVRAPVADPFVFTADLGVNALSLAGSVPSEDSRKQLRELSRQLFEKPGLDDRLKVASGAPKNWEEAVMAALRALSRLETGKVALSGLAVTIEGVAPDQGTAVAVSYQLRRDLPSLFSTSESIKWKQASASRDVAAKVLPRIKAYVETKSAWTNGKLPPLTPPPDMR
jgi:hypothetical protein